MNPVPFEAATFGELFGQLVERNDAGRILAPRPLTADVVDDLVHHQPMQAADSAFLQLA